MPLGRDIILHAVKESTQETRARVRERVLPWCEGGRKRRVNCTQNDVKSQFSSLDNFLKKLITILLIFWRDWQKGLPPIHLIRVEVTKSPTCFSCVLLTCQYFLNLIFPNCRNGFPPQISLFYLIDKSSIVVVDVVEKLFWFSGTFSIKL